MKAKIIFENGKAEILLTTENEFEKDLIEKVSNDKENVNFETAFNCDYDYGTYKNHRINIKINKLNK